MFRGSILGVLLATLLGACASGSVSREEQQTLVDRSALAVQEVMTFGDRPQDAQDFLRRSRAVLVCPRVFRAGFFIGGEGGTCVLVGRDGGGSWSSPAFYSLGSGSLGLQMGVQDSALMIMVMTDRGLNALMNSQFTMGAEAAISVATIGAGIQGGTTTAAGADIVAVARTRGLFAGMTLSGTVLTYLPEYARGYYGRDVSARQVVVGMEVHNPGSDPLRAMLMRYGNRQGS
jgi:lipid-binding SYLF domain-containing protein